MAQSLHLEIIVEGVENPTQMSQLKDLACQFGQGCYFAKPLEAERIEVLTEHLGNFQKLELKTEIAV